jgi:tRNA pseudouridine55 synthase
VKVGGERLYRKARRGESVERAARPVTVHALELLAFEPGERPLATLAVTCSGGTYVRALAADLGRAVGTLAHLAALRRVAVGRFTEADAHPLAELEAGGPAALPLRSPAAALSMAVRSLTAAEAAALANGQSLPPSGQDGPVAAVAADGRLVAVIQDGGGRARPRVVLG